MNEGKITPAPSQGTPPQDRAQAAVLLLAGGWRPDAGVLRGLLTPALKKAGLSAPAGRTGSDGANEHSLTMAGRNLCLNATFNDMPLGGEHFTGAIGTFVPAARRAAMMGVIGHHEAHVRLTLSPVSPASPASPVTSAAADAHDGAAAPALLLRAAAALAGAAHPLGLLWGATGRLHSGPGLQEILRSEAPAELFLAPVFCSVGPRRLPAIHFAGARSYLGIGLRLHLIGLRREDAIGAGLAFARTCRTDRSAWLGQSFHHGRQSFRIAHAADNSHVTLIPLPRLPGHSALNPALPATGATGATSPATGA